MPRGDAFGTAAAFDSWFESCGDGLFFMMLDEPLLWDDSIDKDAALERVFRSQRITRVNPAMLAQYGAEASDFLGMTPEGFFAHDPAHGRRLWRDFFDTGHLHDVSNERRFDGSRMWIEGDYNCLYDDHGRITGHFGIQRDVTERRHAEALLRLQQRLGKELAEATELEGLLQRILRTVLSVEGLDSAGVYLSDADGGLTLATHLGLPEAFVAQASSYPPDSPNALAVLRGEPLFGTHEALREQVGCATRPTTLRALAVIPFRSHDRVVGAINVASATAESFDAPERECLLAIAMMIGGAVSRVRSDDELRRQREDLFALFDNMDDLLFVLDAQGDILHCNATALQRLGYSREEILDMNVLDLHPPERREQAATIVQAMLQGEEQFCPIPLLTRAGETIPVETRISKGRLDNQPVILGISRDVRARIEAQAERERLEEHLRHSRKMEALGVLAGGIAHDFNNMLAVIQSNAELALDVMHSERSRAVDDLGEILAAARRGSELITQILAFSRRAEPQLEDLDLNRELQRLQLLLRRTMPRMIDIQLRAEPNLHYVQGDASQITLALMNLTSNARDAMPGGGVLALSTHNLELTGEPSARDVPLPPGRYVEVVVQDNGSGMSGKVLAQAFDPFFTTKGPGKGTGLGLASAYGIVQSHHGWVSIDSSEGQGTTVTVVLPATQGSEAPAAEGAQDPAKPPTPTLLVVDDDEALRRAMKRQLERAGYHVLVAASGEEAVSLYQLEGLGIDVVLLDLGMPGMGGAGCLRKLRDLNPAVRAIVLSGYPPQEAGEAVAGLGAAFVVAKPTPRDTLLDLIRRSLEGLEE
jgi:PAS domain S-box-containing protein